MTDLGLLAQKLISYPSVTPDQMGCLDYIQDFLENLGFTCTRKKFADVDNLYARVGTNQPNLCFAGHVDVVPVLHPESWDNDPFSSSLINNYVYGRGAVDMKGAIAAFMVAIQNRLLKPLNGSISMLLTADEEGPAEHGTKKMVEWLKDQGEVIDFCLVGEPTSVSTVGDMIKVGRRGSLNAVVTVTGVAGHVAYPENCVNPLDILLKFYNRLKQSPLDQGTKDFQPSNLEFTSIDTLNPTSNVIPGSVTARLNIRFNTNHTGHKLAEHLKTVAAEISDRISLDIRISGEAFHNSDHPFATHIANCIHTVCGQYPVLSTSGGTSDARFIKDIAPVVELGLCNALAHKDNERVNLEDLQQLAAIYAHILEAEIYLSMT